MELLSKRCHNDNSVRFNSNIHVVRNKLAKDPYDAISNPTGMINLGPAENHLMMDILGERMSQPDMIAHDCSTHSYFPHLGLHSFRSAIAEFLRENLSEDNPIYEENVVTIAGSNSAVEALSFAIADNGDYFMVPSPCFFGMQHYTLSRAGVHLLPIKCGTDGLTDECLELTYSKGVGQGHNIRAVILINPTNPTGLVYRKSQLVDVMHFCQRHKLHLIVDEVFAFSIHDPDTSFTSILSLDPLEPTMTHFVWGFSKDFGLGGFRAGIIHTLNSNIIFYLSNVYCPFNCIPPLIQQRLTLLVSDKEWFRGVYLPTYRTRLRAAYVKCRETLRAMGAVVDESTAALFLMADFSKFVEEGGRGMAECLLDAGVHCGQLTDPDRTSWLRVVFTVPPSHLDEALARIRTIVEKSRASSKRLDNSDNC